MKELEHKPTVEKHQEANQQKQYKFKATVTDKRTDGLTLWSYNEVTGELKKAKIQDEVKAQSLGSKKDGYKHVKDSKLSREANCKYFWALNLKNAIKKVKKSGQTVEKIS